MVARHRPARARGCARRRRRPRRRCRRRSWRRQRAALRSAGDASTGGTQLGRDHRRVDGPVAPGVGRGGQQVGHRETPSSTSSRDRADHDAAVDRVVLEQVGVRRRRRRLRPSWSRTTRSAWCSHSGDTVQTTVVRPRRRSLTRSAMRASVWASTAEVGSTRTRIGASTASARASTTRCRWPPESPRPRSSSCPCQPSGQRVVDVLGVGDAQRRLGLLAGQPAVRVDGVLEGAGEEAAAGVADQHLAAYVVEARRRQVDATEPHAPRAGRGLLVARGDAGATALAVGPGPAGRAALETVGVVLADRVGVGRQVAAEPVGQRRALLGHRTHDDGQQAGAGGEAAEVVDDLGAAVERHAGRRARATAGAARRSRSPGGRSPGRAWTSGRARRTCGSGRP